MRALDKVQNDGIDLPIVVVVEGHGGVRGSSQGHMGAVGGQRRKFVL